MARSHLSLYRRMMGDHDINGFTHNKGSSAGVANRVAAKWAFTHNLVNICPTHHFFSLLTVFALSLISFILYLDHSIPFVLLNPSSFSSRPFFLHPADHHHRIFKMSHSTRPHQHQQNYYHHHHHHATSADGSHQIQRSQHRTSRPERPGHAQHAQVHAQPVAAPAPPRPPAPAPPPAPPPQKPPSKKELGNAGWTLIHSVAVTYPLSPNDKDKFQATAFLNSIAHLYPCKRCRRHFEKYLVASPPNLSSRQGFMIWACRAHNDVNRRNGKREFPCNLNALEPRWGDCGCTQKKN